MPSDNTANPLRSNHYTTLPTDLFSVTAPEPVAAPALLVLNAGLLNSYDLEDRWFRSTDGLAVLSGCATNPANPPVAMAYAGHQFGHRVPLLGDGRAHMLGQLATAQGLVDVQLKGSGRTPYSRGGDGRATLASVLREYLISEAMAGLNIPATRSLAVIATGETVYREYPEAGAILVRTARSHIRVGSFQLAADKGPDVVQALADHLLQHHYPELHDSELPYAGLLRAACIRQGNLIAQWMLCGFIHGVMNTDNMSLVGETIDKRGRYAWAEQPGIAIWNLSRFAETLLPLLAPDTDAALAIAERELGAFLPEFQQTFYTGMTKKLRLKESVANAQRHKFADSTLQMLSEQEIDMTVFFDSLTRVANGAFDTLLLQQFTDKTVGELWLTEWRDLAADDFESLSAMRQHNPAIIARNHQVEAALLAAVESNNMQPFTRLSEALKNPYEIAAENLDLQTPPSPEERVTATFCGT
jgi:serine/tyrosine/threonine adenylyltransferase